MTCTQEDRDIDVEPAPTTDVGVMIVDDQATFRSTARTVVLLADGFAVVAEAESGEDAVGRAADARPDLVLMDINLPGINGIEATRRIVEAAPDTVVVLMSTYTAEDLPADAGSCGARRYVHKEDLSPDVLREVWDEHAPS
ncbi:response regulator [Dermatobacter hominis]|uniref:response regulator n=1 Tax=Dermatobacter hominis TaxID=2884263 RepID=UPI001D10B30A|nr:response regulator transcription factor [Dermatobacter hominis]UDY35678.1 response regulator transcription factor [Dermatobacter hominis]